MPMKKCPDCGLPVGDYFKTCPKCGATVGDGADEAKGRNGLVTQFRPAGFCLLEPFFTVFEVSTGLCPDLRTL